MKIKTTMIAASMMFACITATNAATFAVNNVVNFATDTLYATSDSMPLVGGQVTVGYFPDGVMISSIGDLTTNLGSFTVLSAAISGASPDASNIAGYAATTTANDLGQITAGNALLGRMVYSIFGNAATLEESSQFGVVAIGAILDDVPTARSYTSNPAGRELIVGSTGTWTGDIGVGLGDQTYSTVNLVPEPSVALLGAFGILGLLRRRR